MEFNNPGARSLGLGGAFIALADDATAAEANPAGLTNLLKPEISLEYQHVSALEGNTREGNTLGVYPAEAVHNLPFASFVLPANRFVFALYRHQFWDVKSPAREGEFAGTGLNYGVAAGYRFMHNLRFGVSFKLEKTSRGIENVSTDFSAGISAGILLKPISSFSAGIAYRFGDATDSLGLGISYQLTDRLLIAADVVEVIDDWDDFSSELYVGAEYVFFIHDILLLSPRVGFFRKDTYGSPTRNPTLGVGIVMAENFQIDFAYRLQMHDAQEIRSVDHTLSRGVEAFYIDGVTFKENVMRLSVSTVYRF